MTTQLHVRLQRNKRLQHSMAAIFEIDSWIVWLDSWWGRRGSKYHWKWAMIGQPVKHHLNGISRAGRWWPNIECWPGFFTAYGPVVLRTLDFCQFSKGFGVLCSLSGSAHVRHLRDYSRKSHMRFRPYNVNGHGSHHILSHTLHMKTTHFFQFGLLNGLTQHALIQEVFSEGVQFWPHFFSWLGKGGSI